MAYIYVMPLSANRPLISFDWAIKRLLRQKANFNILEGFISELLEEDVIIKSIPESETNKARADSKYNKFNLLCENHKGELLAIELQFYPELDFLQRMCYLAHQNLLPITSPKAVCMSM